MDKIKNIHNWINPLKGCCKNTTTTNNNHHHHEIPH